jgi:hypothetical protein
MKALHTYLKYIIAIYMAFHFVSNGVFAHTHEIDGKKISHSHPFTGKSHSSNEAQQILNFDAASYLSEDSILPETPATVTCNRTETLYNKSAVSANFNHSSSRAPPVFSKF